MELSNEFKVPAPIDQAWSVLTDVERIAPCMPGAQLQEVEGDEYRGTVKVKVGPITVEYKGTARFVEKDDAQHKIVLRASGRDTRGQGNATATVTAELRPEGDKETVVSLVTDLDITGKVAQFGRGMLADVSTKLLGQFADSLEKDLLSGAPGGAPAAAGATATPGQESPSDGAGAASSSAPASGARTVSSPEAKPVDLVEVVGSSVMKRVAPVVAAVAGALAFVFFWRRRRS